MNPVDEVYQGLYAHASARHALLVNLLEMPQEDFSKSECGLKNWTIAEALSLSSSDLPPKGKNDYDNFMRVRELVRSNLDHKGTPWINTRGNAFISGLMQRKLVCIWCNKSGLSTGVMAINKSSVNDHGCGLAHVQKLATRQLTLEGVGINQDLQPSVLKAQQQAVLSDLTVGWLVGNGIAPRAIPRIFTADFLELQGHMKSGYPASHSTVFNGCLPRMRQHIEEYIRDHVISTAGSEGSGSGSGSGEQVYFHMAITVDGGSCKAAGNVKVIAVMASSRKFGDVLLHLKVMRSHENGEMQAALLEEIRVKYRIPKENIHFVSADGVSLNATCVSFLRSEFGWDVEHARCAPHGFNRIFVAFLTVMDEEYSFTSHLKAIRGFFNAGGTASRRARLVEYAFSLSAIDFVDTRWASLIKAIKYLMVEQTPRELEKAEKRLDELASSGDTSAQEALDDPGEVSTHFNVIYECLESFVGDVKEESEKERRKLQRALAPGKDDEQGDGEGGDGGGGGGGGGGGKPKRQRAPAKAVTLGDDGGGDDVGSPSATLDKILANHASLDMFACLTLISTVLASVPSIFKMLQGGAQWAEKFKKKGSGGVYTSGVRAVKELLAHFKLLLDKGADGAAVMKDTIRVVNDKVLAQVKMVGDRSVEYGELDEDDLDTWLAEQNEKAEEALQKVERVFKKALTAVDKCAALPKLQETLTHLEVSERFNLVCPIPPPPSYALARAFFGLPDNAPPATLTSLLNDYTAHFDSFTSRPDYRTFTGPPNMTPKLAYEYWERQREALPHLAPFAFTALCRPVSSACVERVFSMLTLIDTATRRTLGMDHLSDLLFFRMHTDILEGRMHSIADSVRHGYTLSTSSINSDRAKAVDAAAANWGKGGGGGGGGGGEGGGEEEEVEMDFYE